jgi:hypothetical protein
MSKPRLVLYHSPYQTESFFHSTWFKNIVNEHFWIDYYDENVKYLDDAVFVLGCNHYLETNTRELFVNRRVIVDALWESNTGKWEGCGINAPQQHLILYGNQPNSNLPNLHFVPNWFWYNESLWYTSREYHTYEPKRTYQKKLLLPSGKDRGWRLEVLELLKPWLEDSYWSNVSHGIFLPGTISAKRMDHRWFNPIWYDDTHLSIILESMRSWEEGVGFLTEKTYKPISFCHPFMLVAKPGCLKFLKTQGFETFDNIFDESYDMLDSLPDKLKVIISNLENFSWGQSFDMYTEGKLAYNRARFYDYDLINEMLIKDIIHPIYQYLES